jgi:hypothetical protein
MEPLKKEERKQSRGMFSQQDREKFYASLLFSNEDEEEESHQSESVGLIKESKQEEFEIPPLVRKSHSILEFNSEFDMNLSS